MRRGGRPNSSRGGRRGALAGGRGRGEGGAQAQASQTSSSPSSDDQSGHLRQSANLKSWTGKSPLSLLHELCQRNGWLKPQVDTFKARGEDGLQCRVTLSRRDKKTNEVKTISFAPREGFRNGMDAKHYSAVFTLQAVNGQMPMHRVLAPGYRDYFLELEAARKAGKLDFLPTVGSDPFVDKEKVPSTKVLASTKSAGQKSTSAAPFLSVVRMNEEARQMIVSMLSGYESTGQSAASDQIHATKVSMESFTKLGFHPHHVKEAMANSRGRDGIIHWLCLRLPESDLPKGFQAAGWEVSGSCRDRAGLAKEYSARRMAEILSFPTIRCTQAIDDCHGDVNEAICSLLRCIVEGSDGWEEPVLDWSMDHDAAAASEMRHEEVMVLQEILGDRYTDASDDGQPASISLQLQPTGIASWSGVGKSQEQRSSTVADCHLDIYQKPDSLYPFTAPSGLVVRCDKWPCYTRLLVMQTVGRHAARLACDCDGMVFLTALVDWLEETIPILLQTPPLLAHLAFLRKGNDATVDGTLPEASSDSAEASGDIAAQSVSRPYRQQTGQAAHGSLAPFRKKLTMPEAVRLGRDLMTELTRRQSDKTNIGMQKQRQRLPASRYEEELVQVIKDHSITIVQGETGCGKSTQVPQFILDDAWKSSRGDQCFIVVTQPRRLAAVAVAERVAAERGEKIGKYVGYSVRLESKTSVHTRLLFCTIGVVLRWCQDPGRLSRISHLIIDEVHERSVDTDTLLALMRLRMQHECRNLKLVLMSATLHTGTLLDFFRACPEPHSEGHAVRIPGFTHPVDIQYWDQVRKVTNYPPARYDLDRQKKLDVRSSVEALDLDIVAHCVAYLVQRHAPSVMLVFLPGLAEILKCISLVASSSAAKLVTALPLHSSLTPSEQHRIFEPARKGLWKIVFTTNIAETSITVDGVTHVLDCGRVKQMNHDPSSGMQRLVEVWTSQSSCRQRSGRAGRTAPGVCWRLFSTEQWAMLKVEDTPEIQRTSLEQLCLQALSLLQDEDISILRKLKSKTPGKTSAKAIAASASASASASAAGLPEASLGDSKDVVPAGDAQRESAKLLSLPGCLPTAKFLLRYMLAAPSVEAVAAAMTSLMHIEAVDGEQGFMSNMGKYLCRIPADARIAKCLVLSAVLSCLHPVLTIAACITHRSPFLSPSQERAEAKAAHKRFLSSKSDLLAYANAYDAWCSAKRGGNSSARQFCADNYLSMSAMESISDLRRQFLRSLRDLGLCDDEHNDEQSLNVNSCNQRVVKACLCAGLYPNAACIHRPGAVYQQTEHGSVLKTPAAKELSFRFAGGKRAFVHPSSLLFEETSFDEDPVVVFHEKKETSRVFLHGISAVAPYQLLLFCGKLRALHEEGCITMDGWMRFQAPGHVVSLLLACRQVLDQELAIKLVRKEYNISASPLMRAVVKLVTTDGVL